MTPIGGGVTLPVQITDAFLVHSAKAAGKKDMKRRMAEKHRLGQPEVICRSDLYHCILTQRERTEAKNESENLIVKAALGTGLLGFRHVVDGREVEMVAVGKELELNNPAFSLANLQVVVPLQLVVAEVAGPHSSLVSLILIPRHEPFRRSGALHSVLCRRSGRRLVQREPCRFRHGRRKRERHPRRLFSSL